MVRAVCCDLSDRVAPLAPRRGHRPVAQIVNRGSDQHQREQAAHHTRLSLKHRFPVRRPGSASEIIEPAPLRIELYFGEFFPLPIAEMDFTKIRIAKNLKVFCVCKGPGGSRARSSGLE